MPPREQATANDAWARGRAILETLLGDAAGERSRSPSIERGEGRRERARALAEGIVWLRETLRDARLA